MNWKESKECKEDSSALSIGIWGVLMLFVVFGILLASN